MYRDRNLFIRVVVLGALCAGLFRVAAADDYTYQSLTNLGPCASSRVLLMNNDTNSVCPILGQGYHDTNETDTAVGGTFWWHDGTAKPTGVPNLYLQLMEGANHILYQKTDVNGGKKALWTLVECRAGSGGYHHATAEDNNTRNYLPWSSTCQPIDTTNFASPIPDEWRSGAANLGGIKQVAHISMRCTEDAMVYSPLYEDGIGEIYFDVVNGFKLNDPDSIAVQIATDVIDTYSETGFVDGLDWDAYDWKTILCDQFVVHNLKDVALPDENRSIEKLTLATTNYFNKMYFRVRAKVNHRGAIRFRIRRLSSNANTASFDYNGLIFIDNIIVSYPGVAADISTVGIKSESDDSSQNGGRANIGYVGAFTEPLLSRGLASAKPRMTFSAMTDGQPPWVTPLASILGASCVYRWRYLDQAYGAWKTNTTENIEVIEGTNIVWDSAIEVPDQVGDIEFSYMAFVSGTHYRYFDFALDDKLGFPDETAAASFVQCATNFTARIREGVSPWQEMHLVAEICTNAPTVSVATNDWTMELTGDHTWRGFVWTPTNYTDKVAHIKFVGRNLWETNGVKPILESRTWYFPPAETATDALEIPKGYVAVTNLGGAAGWDEGSKERDVTLDCSAGYLIFEFNDESGAFTLNRAEYQDFNKWTPEFGQAENRYIGNYVNTSYVGVAKQEYSLEMGSLPMSRSSSAYWWENFDLMAGNKDYPFNVPFEESITPNGWTASKGMYVNGMFSTATNKTTYGMALQLEGRGNGMLSLIDPADVPQGIGTVAFSARLAQYLEFGDFCYYVDGTARNNYAISAKAAMTHRRQQFSDVSIGSPSISLVAYYRPGLGCYEFRVTRVYATYNNLWDANGVMEISIYKWEKVDRRWNAKKLKSLRLGSNSTYVPVVGRQYTNGTTKVNYANYFVPPNSGANVTDNEDWTTIYFAAYTLNNTTYLEGGVGGKATTTHNDGSDDQIRKEIIDNTGIMMAVSATDSDNCFKKGSYGVCSCECPAVFGNIQTHSVSRAYPYRGAGTGFAEGELEAENIRNGDWGSTAVGRIVTWADRKAMDGEDYSSSIYGEVGLCTAMLAQQLYLRFSDNGDSSNWRDSGLQLNLMSYLPTNVVFAPHTITPANVQIKVGGTSEDDRIDVVVDDIELSQWAGDSSVSSDLGSTVRWAYTDAWIAGSTNAVYQSGGASSSDDPVAYVSRCGYYCYKVEGTENEYIYVFTNTVNGALGSYATFTPKYDITVKELFVLGGGGGGGPGGGGGGGGESLWITNAVDYAGGETGIRVYVGRGGGGGTTRVYANASVSGGGNGENSYVWMKNPFNPSAALEQYRGYGGYRGGWLSNTSGNAAGNGSSTGGGAGGGSACKNTTRAYGREIYGAGYGGAADGGAPGGGGGGGLRGIGDNGSNYAAGGAPNPRSVIYAGSNGTNGVGEVNGGRGGNGFPISLMGDSPVRTAIGDLLGDQDAWLGGGGGGGSGFFRATSANTNSWWGIGAPTPGNGGSGGGGGGGLYSAGTYSNYQPGMGAAGTPFTGGGGGGGSFNNPVTSGGSTANNWILGGGAGGSGLVVMRVQVKDRFVMLQPMRGEESEPMSVRTPFLNGISLFSFSWKWADSNAVLHVQIATNGVDETTIRSRTTSLSSGWTDWCTINFKDMEGARRNVGATNILIGLRAPISGIVRILSDPGVVADARKGSTNNLYSMYGTVCITGIKVLDEPALDDRSWWGWNIMPTYELKWSSLYDPVTLGPGRSCGLNFSGNKADTGADDPLFADDPEVADYMKHDPFVQTPRFTNRIGAVSFKARVLETNLTQSGWVTISGCADPGEEDDAKWDVLTNIEITASTTIFTPYLWRIPTSQSSYQALRLSTFGAAEGRNHSEETTPAQPFGDHGTANPTPIQRVLIDEVTVTQPMHPEVAFVNARPFRMKLSDDAGNAIAADLITSEDAQPLLGETFGLQAQLMPTGLEDELDVSSIRVYMAWYAGESPWGYENWKNLSGAVTGVELARAKDWSEGNLVYRSAPSDIAAFIPPQLPGDYGYQIVQYHLWAEYRNKNGIEYKGDDAHQLSASDWTLPTWYRGIDDPNRLSAGTFSAYTVLDSISPKRAWINEINMFDGNLSDTVHQYLEIAVPQGFDMTGWTLHHFKNDDTYTAYSLASFGTDLVSFKSKDATNSYAFIVAQSPQTKAAGSYPGVDDGTWKSTAFDGGVEDVTRPYALRLQRPTGIIEHEIVFMCTNTSTSRVRYQYEGTNFQKNLKANLPDCDWVYAGADAYSGSLSVYTNHGEATSCWTNMMVQTPGKVNRFADGTPQFIDPDYFDPPGGTNLWIYANIDGGSQNSLAMVIGTVTNTSAVLIVPQDPDTGTFSTSIVYVVKKWFEMDSVVTNEYGKSGGPVADASGQRGVWTLDLSNLKLSDSNSRKFEVTASTRNSSNIPDAAHGGISPDDPYYPAVIDWLQNYPEKTIHLAPFWTLADEQVYWNDKPCILNLKEMYWFNIPPVTDSDTDEWVFKGGMGSGAYPDIATNIVAGGLVTNIRVAVTMMITNQVTKEAYPPNMLRGLEPGSTSQYYDETAASWTSVTFKVTGALQIPGYGNVYRPLRWFTFGQNSFTNGFTRLIEVRDPFSTRSPGFSYEWYKHPGNPIFYRWRVDDDEASRPPDTVYQLNDENAMLPSVE